MTPRWTGGAGAQAGVGAEAQAGAGAAPTPAQGVAGRTGPAWPERTGPEEIIVSSQKNRKSKMSCQKCHFNANAT